MSAEDDSSYHVVGSVESMPTPASHGRADDAPTRGPGVCSFCGEPSAVWLHPLDPERTGFLVYGKGHTLPTFWMLCDRCETVYRSGNDDDAVAIMRASRHPDVDDRDVAELLRKPVAALRSSDRGARRLDTSEPPAVAEARARGFVPLREVSGAGDELGPLWPAEHRLWLDDLGPTDLEDEFDEVLDRWSVRSPWPRVSVAQVLNALWRRVSQTTGPRPRRPEEDHPLILEFFTSSETDVMAWAADPEP